jgi:TonB family protein
MERGCPVESFAFSERRVSREEFVAGLGGSILVHALVLAAALVSAWVMPGKALQTPYFSVNLVSLQDLGPGFSGARKSPGDSATASVKNQDGPKSTTAPRASSTPVVPVKRLKMDEPAVKAEPELKKLQSPEAPKAVESNPNSAAVEKSLDKLIAKPKLQPKPTPIVQSSREESDKQTGGRERADQGASDDDQRANRNASAGRTAAQGGASGGSEGSPSGSVDGSGRVASALLGMYGNRVKEAINREWAMPDMLKPQGLEARLIVVVSRDGKVLDLRVEKASGNSLFDESAVRAVRRASPLPALPEVITYPKVEIDIRFRPEGLS